MSIRMSFRRASRDLMSPRGEDGPNLEIEQLSGIVDMLGEGATPAEKTRSAVQLIRQMFAHPSDAVITTSVRASRPNKRFIMKESKFFFLMNVLMTTSLSACDLWSSLELPREVWTGKAVPFNVVRPSPTEFQVETDRTSVSHITDLSEYTIVNVEEDYHYFEFFFSNNCRLFRR